MKKRKIIIFIVIFIVFITIASVISELGKDVDVIYDVTEYAYISKDELIQKIGEPLKIDGDVYIYEEKEFTIKNNIVTKFKYLPNESISYKRQNDIFRMFGITPNKNTIKKVVDNNSTYKFQNVTNKIWEFEIYGMNEKNKTFDIIFVSYQDGVNID